MLTSDSSSFKQGLSIAPFYLSKGLEFDSVIIMDDEFEGNNRSGYQEFELVTPYQGGDYDQYLPLGDGWLLLVGMGSAYLLKKARKKKKS